MIREICNVPRDLRRHVLCERKVKSCTTKCGRLLRIIAQTQHEMFSHITHEVCTILLGDVKIEVSGNHHWRIHIGSTNQIASKEPYFLLRCGSWGDVY